MINMVLSDWTLTSNDGALNVESEIDNSEFWEGLSSFKMRIKNGGFYLRLARITASDVRVVIVAKMNAVLLVSGTASLYVTHPADNEIFIPLIQRTDTGITDWTKYRVTFWLDTVSGINWARVEYWDLTNEKWVYVSDTDYGSGTFTNELAIWLYVEFSELPCDVSAWIDNITPVTEAL